LKPSEAVLYADAIGEVVSDLMVRLRDERSRSPSGVLVGDVANLLYRFALEGISYILFETRIGCLKQQVPAETQHFIDSINLMFKNSIFATVLPRWSRKVLPFWDRYLNSWDTIFAFGKTLIDRKMEELEGQVERGKEVSGYLSYLLASGRLSLDEVYGSPHLPHSPRCSLLPQTSNTLSWALYHLSRDPGIQETMYQELKAVVPADRFPGAEDIPKMPMLRAVIKETLRVYPVVPTNARVFYEKDIVIGDYLFPKNVSGSCAVGTSAVLSGLRPCGARRIAELEMHLALARIIQAFEVRPDPRGVEVTSVSRIVLVADKPINLEFIARPG
ncbi:hypothetical protein N325_06420, partial [Colius striatus]